MNGIKLQTKDLSKSYDGRLIIDNINIQLNKNEIVSIIGLSGSGKTTLFNLLSGLEMPDKGQVLLDGEEITGKPGKISYMLQKDLLLPHKKIIDNVVLGLIVKGMSKKEAYKKCEGLFEAFGIEETKNLYPNQLSGGMRQRAAFLRTYLSAEGVALLDEPFSALDTITKGNMHKWYIDMMEKLELATIFITHDIEEALYLSDRIYVLGGNPGTILEEIVINKDRKEREQFMMSMEFLSYKKSLKEMLL
jgi:ABC-type nitrate/sulfonate/bicarbonate transport system ATPase subunit